MKVPVLVIAFNRVSTLKVLLNRLQSVGATELYFAVDGPRSNKDNDVEKIASVIQTIRDTFNPDDTHFLIQVHNLGIRKGPPTAISWFFSQVEAGIILEDDCIPGDDFFAFVSWALERYRNVDKIKMIAGFNRFGSIKGPYSYYFIKTAMIWGWATWRRAWVEYDADFVRWRSVKDKKRLDHWLGLFPVRDFWREAVAMVDRGQLVTWDTAWCWTIFNQQGLVIIPSTSLIQNIGFGEDATNTASGWGVDERSLVLPGKLLIPYREPKKIKPDNRLQRRLDRKEFWRTDDLVSYRLRKCIRRIIGSCRLGKNVLKAYGIVKRFILKR